MKQMAWVVMAVAACGDGGSATPDSKMIDAPTTCAPKTAPLAAGMFKLYVNFDGVTLTKGNDDATMNVASVVVNDPTVVPMWQPALSASTRQGRIDATVDYVQRALAPYSIDVVSARPTGAYMMIAIGGKPQDLGFAMGSLGVAPQKCSPNFLAVSLDFDVDGLTAIDYANTILSDTSVFVGMGLSTRHNDCANRTSPYDPGLICTFDSMSPTASTNNCNLSPSQDEPKLLMDAFGCRN